jgi:hypothetical protein
MNPNKLVNSLLEADDFDVREWYLDSNKLTGDASDELDEEIENWLVDHGFTVRLKREGKWQEFSRRIGEMSYLVYEYVASGSNMWSLTSVPKRPFESPYAPVRNYPKPIHYAGEDRHKMLDELKELYRSAYPENPDYPAYP